MNPSESEVKWNGSRRTIPGSNQHVAASSPAHTHIWRRVVAKDDLAALEQEHAVISTRLFGGHTITHVFAEEARAQISSPQSPT